MASPSCWWTRRATSTSSRRPEPEMAASAAGTPWPTEIKLKKREKVLEVAFDDGRTFVLPAELLRVESPSAEVRGHGGEKQIVSGRRHVGIIDVQMVGNYA